MKVFLRSSAIALFAMLLFVTASSSLQRNETDTQSNTKPQETQVLPSAIPTATMKPPPNSHLIPQKTHIYQSFNNCGPASLSMLLSYNNLNISQDVLGQKLRPYQNTSGIDDDKSVTIEELTLEAASQGLTVYHRRNGSILTLKQFVAQDIPVLVRTWLHPDEDIGHYRIIRGYNDSTQKFMQDDSYQGDNLEYDYKTFESMWQPFNYEYMVAVPKSRKDIVTAILQQDTDEKTAWENALQRAEKESTGTTTIYPMFNKVVALTHLGRYQEAVSEFEKIESSLPPRMLWYQIEPIVAYLETKQYDRVFQITDWILNNNNRGFSELYILRGKAHAALGNTQLAKVEFENAVFYNRNLQEAHSALESVTTQ